MRRVLFVAAIALLGGCEALIGADFDPGRLAVDDAGKADEGGRLDASEAASDAPCEADACNAPPPPAPANVLSSSKGFHTCAITPAGGVKCWGLNKYGGLGNDSNTDSPTPVQVVGLTSGVIDVGAGSGHSCAVTSSGVLSCWGASYSGQLGDSDLGEEHVPQVVSGLGAKVIALAVGELHTCALLETTGVKCWGENASGQLGNSTMSPSSVPVTVTGLTSGVKAISAGSKHSCAVLTTGDVKCWGADVVAEGQNALAPVSIAGLEGGAASVACGFTHSCAIMMDGTVRCWGVGADGELGTGNTTAYSAAALSVMGIGGGTTKIAAGQAFTCAVVSGAARCWGANADGELGDGDGDAKSAPSPVAVKNLGSGVVDIMAGVTHACAATASHALSCWGAGTDGQLGDDASGTPSAVPVAVVDFP